MLPNHPCTNNQVERRNSTIKEATIRKYHYTTRDNLKENLQSFVDADNFAKGLKVMKWFAVFDFINKCRLNEPD